MVSPFVFIALAGVSLLATTLAVRLRAAGRYAARLRESERRLEGTQRLGRMGWWRTDVSSGLTELSTELRRVFCVADDDDLTQEYFMAIIHEDDRDQVMEQ